MRLDHAWVDYSAAGESVSAYRVGPPGLKGAIPAVVVIQEVWGPDAHICDVADRFAAAGYLAFAPDLYSGKERPASLSRERIDSAKQFLDQHPMAVWMDRSKREEALSKEPEDRRESLRTTIETLFSPDRPTEYYLDCLKSATAYLRDLPECTGKIASIGFCMGGGLSARLAAHDQDLDLAINFYGMAPDKDEIAKISCPVLGFFGEEDKRINEGLPAFSHAMQDADKTYEQRIYPGAGHAFFNDTRPSYNVDAARDAWATSLFFMADNLVPR